MYNFSFKHEIEIPVKIKRNAVEEKSHLRYSLSSRVTRVCGVTVSAFARRWEADGFKSRHKPRHS